MPSSKGKSATKRGGKTPPTGARRSLRNAGRNHDNSKSLNNRKIGTAPTDTDNGKEGHTAHDNGKDGGVPSPVGVSPVAVDDIGRANRARRASQASPKGSPLLEGPKARAPGPRGPANQMARGAPPPAPEPEPTTPEPPSSATKKQSSTPLGDRLEQFQVEETLRRSVAESDPAAVAQNTRNPQEDAPVVAKDEKPSDQDLAREASAAVHQVEDGLRAGNRHEGGGFGQVLRGQFDQVPGVPQRVGLPATEAGYYPAQPAPEPVVQGLPGQTAAPCTTNTSPPLQGQQGSYPYGGPGGPMGGIMLQPYGGLPGQGGPGPGGLQAPSGPIPVGGGQIPVQVASGTGPAVPGSPGSQAWPRWS